MSNVSSPFVKYDVMRPLNWRYERVRYLIDKPDGEPIQRCTPRDDPETKKIRKFVIEYKKRAPRNRPELINEFPGLWFAYSLYQADEDERLRHYVEARLMARQTDKEIARQVGTFPEAIKWYEAAFYNVRDRFAAKDWIVRQILDSVDSVGEFDAISSYATLKLFGYFAGPVMVDAIISGFSHDRAPEDIKEAEEFYEDYYIGAVKRQAALSIRALQIDSTNVMQLLNLCAKLVEMRRLSQDGEGTFTSMEQNINVFWKEIEPIVGTKKGREGDDDLLIELDSQAAELRDHQLQALGSPATTAEDVEAIKTVVMNRKIREVKEDDHDEQPE